MSAPLNVLQCYAEALGSYCSLNTLGALLSFATMNLVPIQTPLAPNISAAATLLPSFIPPAATSVTGFPVRGDLYCLHTSAHAGMRTLVAMSPVWPPPSPPCAMMMSAPAWHALWTCLGCPIMLPLYEVKIWLLRWVVRQSYYSTPALCSFSIAHCGGTPTADTKSFAPPSMTMSRSTPS